MILKNMGSWERIIRIALGLLMLAVGWLGDTGSMAAALRIFALYPLITGLAAWCPIYTLVRFSSRR